MQAKEKIVISEFWIYPLYILLACAVTSALNVVHTKYILGSELHMSLFYVPIIAGVIFGYAAAKIRIARQVIIYHSDVRVFVHYILLSCLVTFSLNVVHTEWVLGRDLEPALFTAPLIAGIFFGYLLATIKTLNNSLAKMATTDSLTGTVNRMHFDHLLQLEIEKVKRYGGKFSIIFFDLDYFKKINDEFGHKTGDTVLIELSTIIKKHSRCSDLFSRYGGEEFIILLNATGLDGALKCANQLREIIQLHSFSRVKKVTCSFGVVEYDKNEPTPVIELADKALYKAKNAGRNRVEIFDAIDNTSHKMLSTESA